MSAMHWFRFEASFFDESKIKLIRKYPAGDTIIVVWVHLCCLATKSQTPGIIQISDGCPYTPEDLAAVIGVDKKTIELALGLFERYGMLSTNEGNVIELVNWSKNQGIERLDEKRKLAADRKKRWIERNSIKQIEERVQNASGTQTEREGTLNSTVHIHDNTVHDINKTCTKQESIELPHGNLFAEAWFDWLEYRKQRRKPYKAKVTITAKLKELSEVSEIEAVDAIRKSISNGWDGIFTRPGRRQSASDVFAEVQREMNGESK